MGNSSLLFCSGRDGCDVELSMCTCTFYNRATAAAVGFLSGEDGVERREYLQNYFEVGSIFPVNKSWPARR